MIFHLMKYEIQSTYRVFLTIVCSFALLTLLLCLGITNESAIILLLFSLASVAIGFGTFFGYFITIIQRYYKGLYGREGYLMLTLPVSGWQLVLSKFLVAMFWTILLGIAIGLCLLFTIQWIILLSPNHYQIFRWSFLKDFIHTIGIKNIILFGMVVLATIAQTIAHIYVSIAIAYLPCFKKWNIPLALFVYFVINILEQILLLAIYSILEKQFVSNNYVTNILADTINRTISYWNGYSLVFLSLCITVIFLGICSYTMTKKVNLR